MGVRQEANLFTNNGTLNSSNLSMKATLLSPNIQTWLYSTKTTMGLLYHTIFNHHTFHTLPYFAILCHTLPYSAVHYHTLPYSTILYHTLPYSAVHYHALPSSTKLYHTLPYSTILYHTLPYSAVHYHALPSSTKLYHTLPSKVDPCNNITSPRI